MKILFLMLGMGVSIAGWAAATSWSGTKDFNADESIADEIELSGTVTINVADGKKVILSGALSGEGAAIRKTGKGTLELSGDNAFTGGVTIDAGFVRATSDHALGSGKVTITAGGKQKCELDVVGRNVGAKNFTTATITLTNDIDVVGQTTCDYPALMFFYQNAVLNGKITAARDLIYYDDLLSTKEISSSQYNRYDNVRAATFNGDVTVGGMLGTAGLTQFIFNGKVSCDVFSMAVNRTKQRSTDEYYGNNWHVLVSVNQTATARVVQNNNGLLYLGAADTFKDAFFDWPALPGTGWEGGCGTITPCPYGESTAADQEIAGFRSPGWEGAMKVESSGVISSREFPWDTGSTTAAGFVSGMGINGGSAMTYTLVGLAPEEGQTTRELVTCQRIMCANITVDAYDGFTQVFSNRYHRMSGTLWVKKGAVRFAGSAMLPALPTLKIEAGASFSLESTNANALAGLTTLTVNGTLHVAETATTPFAEKKMNLNLGPEAVLDIPVDMPLVIKKLKVGDREYYAGSYTHAALPMLPEGLTLEVTENGTVPAATTTAVWTGASGESTLMSTAENWAGATTPNLTDGLTAVTVGTAASDTTLTYADGMRVNRVANEVPLVLEKDLPTKPVVIGPEKAGDRLVLEHGIDSQFMAQLVLKGYLALSSGNGGTATAGNPLAINFAYAAITSDVLPKGIIEGSARSSGNHTTPLILSDATVELPIFIYNKDATQGTAIHAATGTVNILKGHVAQTGYQTALSAEKDAVLELRGGFNGVQTVRLVGPGEIRVVDKPMIQLGTFAELGAKVVLDAEGNVFSGNSAREGFGVSKGSLEFRRSGCFSANGDQQLYFGSKSETLTIAFNQTTQRVGRANFVTTNAKSALTGEYPAMLEVTGKTRSGATASCVKELGIDAPVTGGLGFHVCGGGAVLPLAARAYASCGDLEASAGTLSLAAGATWLNGTNFTVRGTGRIVFAARRAVNSEIARFHFADQGKVSIPAGVTLRVAEAEVCEGGVWLPVPRGKYRASSEGVLADHLDGEGTFAVGPSSTVIHLR